MIGSLGCFPILFIDAPVKNQVTCASEKDIWCSEILKKHVVVLRTWVQIL